MIKMKMKFGLVLLLAGFTFNAMAEKGDSDGNSESSESVEETIESPTSTAGGIIGSVEVRPSMDINGANANEYHTENNVILGYKFNPNTSVMYRQEFNTNLFNPTKNLGVNPEAKDGIFVAKFNNIWTSAPAGLAFSYEPRVYLPTDLSNQADGMITHIRQYLKLTKVFNDKLALTVMETPILMLYNRAGTIATDGTATANPYFQNRVYAVLDVNFTSKLALSVPFIWNLTRFSSFANSAFGDTWHHKLWVYPELTYAIDDNFQVGVGYMSQNMLSYNADGSLAGLDITTGLNTGTAQAIFSASL